MTNPDLRDPERNYEYYRTTTAYQRSDARFKEPRNEWAAEWVRKLAPARLLDLGANDGYFAMMIPPETEYFGMELNPVAIQNAYPRAAGRIQAGNVMEADLGTGWPIIWIGETLEHVPDPKALVRRIKDALAIGGHVIATSAAGHGECHEPGNLEHLREWNPPEFVALFRDAGFALKDGVLAHVHTQRYTSCVLAEKVVP